MVREKMDIGAAWAYGRNQLSGVSDSADLDARLLLEHVLGVSYSYLLAHREEPLTAVQVQTYRQLIARAWRKEPVPYLTGQAHFYGMTLQVDAAVLIPRPETERLVDLVLAWAAPRQPLHLVDVGTGSGCIAIALARHLDQAVVTAVDISAAALWVARQNAERLAPGRIEFRQGSLLQVVPEPIDLIVANLPYVADDEWTLVDDGVKLFEPAVALQGGTGGVELVDALLRQAVGRLRPRGAIFLEIGWQQGEVVSRLARAAFPNSHVEVIADYAGHDRIVAVRPAVESEPGESGV